jgi:HlyD family secretion protein
MLIRAPLSGLVLHKHLEAGEMASPGVPIVTLVDPEDVWLRAFVPETEVGRLRIGQPASITVDAYPERRFKGVVSEIASEAEFTPRNVQTRKERVNLVFRIKIAAKNPDGVLKPGLPADAEIHP